MAVIAARQVFTQFTQLGQVNAPANVANKRYMVLLDMDPVDAADPAKCVSIRLEQRATSNDPWRDNGGIGYRGGTYFARDNVTPQVSFGFVIAGWEIAGQQVRMVIAPGHGFLPNGQIDWTPGDTFNTGVVANVL